MRASRDPNSIQRTLPWSGIRYPRTQGKARCSVKEKTAKKISAVKVLSEREIPDCPRTINAKIAGTHEQVWAQKNGKSRGRERRGGGGTQKDRLLGMQKRILARREKLTATTGCGTPKNEARRNSRAWEEGIRNKRGKRGLEITKRRKKRFP